MVFREDDSRIRTDHAPENMTLIRKIALNLLTKESLKGQQEEKAAQSWMGQRLPDSSPAFLSMRLPLFIQGIVDASTNVLYVNSISNGGNIFISGWINNVLGYEIYEIQALGFKYMDKLVHPSDREHMVSEHKKLLKINDAEFTENEYRFRHRQGNWRWLLCRETVFQRDLEGIPTQVFGTATDITKQKHTRMALHDLNRGC